MWKLHEIQISLSINKTSLEHGFTHLFIYLWLLWVVAVEIVRPAKPKIFTYLVLFTRSLPTSILKDGEIWRSLAIPELVYLTEMGILCFGSGNWFLMFSSVIQLCLTICKPMDCSTLGLPVHHQLLEFTQIHVHWVGDAIQPSHLLLSLSPPALNLSQHQGLFKGVSSSHQVAKGLEFQLQHQSFQWTPRTDLL